MNKERSITDIIISKTLRVPIKYIPEETVSENSLYARETIARQLDVVLMKTGFKASKKLLDYIMCLDLSSATDYSKEIVNAVKTLVGDHLEHNTYFIDFPKNVPTTIEFWTSLIERTYGKKCEDLWNGNLLELDTYGEYQHSYDEMLEAHEDFAPKLPRKFKLLDLGGNFNDEAIKILRSLMESNVPANEEDLDVLRHLSKIYISGESIDDIPVREHKAIVNAERFTQGYPVQLDTTTDFLRLVVELCGGDISLETKTKFKSFKRSVRARLLNELDKLVASDERKLGDVFKYKERFKRLDEVLHSNDYPEANYAVEVFHLAREGGNLSLNSKVEAAFKINDIRTVCEILESRPGMFIRSFNRIIKDVKVQDLSRVLSTLTKALEGTSTKAILGFRQYIQNREDNLSARLFINKKGTGKVVPNEEAPINENILQEVKMRVDSELMSRMPEGEFIIEQGFEKVALPITNKQTADGFNVMPRGSIDTIKGNNIRLFTYWREKSTKTDYDLSVILLDKDFKKLDQVSYTNIVTQGIKHSGDVTSGKGGATEFIDIKTEQLKKEVKYIIAQVNNYSGEDFDKVPESFFGYMDLEDGEYGKPFKALAVETKAELRGDKSVALPIVFIKEDNGWGVKWINALIQGYSWGNATENNALSSATLVRSYVETNYLNLEYFIDLLESRAKVHVYNPKNGESFVVLDSTQDVTYIGKNPPEELPEHAKRVNLNNLSELIQ